MNTREENIDYTPEAEPEEALKVYGEHIEKARKYFDLLVRDGDLLGLIGPRELPKLWSRHILNSAVVADLVEDGQLVADVGSGAGFPGIPMAILRPDVRFVLIEPMERRANWLAEVVVPELDLKNVKSPEGQGGRSTTQKLRCRHGQSSFSASQTPQNAGTFDCSGWPSAGHEGLQSPRRDRRIQALDEEVEA
jgi:hypothetical protein